MGPYLIHSFKNLLTLLAVYLKCKYNKVPFILSSNTMKLAYPLSYRRLQVNQIIGLEII